jgi:hypothetical protein
MLKAKDRFSSKQHRLKPSDSDGAVSMADEEETLTLKCREKSWSGK